MYFKTNFPKGSKSAQRDFFVFAERELKNKTLFYSGPAHQPPRYFHEIPTVEEEEVSATIYNHRVSQEEILNDLYVEGYFVLQVLVCSFNEFKNALIKGSKLYPGGRSRLWGDRFLPSHPKESQYIKRPHHHKKILSEQEQFRQAWREQKGFTKDYRRRNSSFYGKTKKIRKFYDNKQHRAWEKECLHHERYESLTNFKNKVIFDFWKID